MTGSEISGNGASAPFFMPQRPAVWHAGRFRLDVQRPLVMGIVNITPDSFSDGGQHASTRQALEHAQALLRHGADILDLGGESTRPGAQAVPLDEELRRVLPVVREAVTWNVPVSVDTYKPEVMQAVLDLGADIINDVWALRWRQGPQGLDGRRVVADHGRCGVCLMHMHRDPQTMQVAPMADPVVPQVLQFLEQQVDVLCGLGVEKARIAVDVGIGFGKTPRQNFELLAQQRQVLRLGVPVLVGWSRKSSLAVMTVGEPLAASERLAPSLAAALIAVQHGGAVVRVHDVKETVQALKVWQEVQQAGR